MGSVNLLTSFFSVLCSPWAVRASLGEGSFFLLSLFFFLLRSIRGEAPGVSFSFLLPRFRKFFLKTTPRKKQVGPCVRLGLLVPVFFGCSVDHVDSYRAFSPFPGTRSTSHLIWASILPCPSSVHVDICPYRRPYTRPSTDACMEPYVHTHMWLVYLSASAASNSVVSSCDSIYSLFLHLLFPHSSASPTTTLLAFPDPLLRSP